MEGYTRREDKRYEKKKRMTIVTETFETSKRWRIDLQRERSLKRELKVWFSPGRQSEKVP